MRIYEVTFDGREKKSNAAWSPNSLRENVAIENGGATEAIELAIKQTEASGSFEIRAAEVKLVGEAP